MRYRRIIIFLLLLGFTLIFGITIDAAQKKASPTVVKKVQKQKKIQLKKIEKHKPGISPKPIIIPNIRQPMKISSMAFDHNGSIPSKYTCDGTDTNPPLQFSDIPQEAKSLVLLMDDPDVPISIRPDGMWDHWVLWNIPPTTFFLKENETPQGVMGKNSGGENVYYPPCPPDREHRYFFKLYALDTILDLPASSFKADIQKAMEGHVISQAELIGRYNRKLEYFQ